MPVVEIAGELKPSTKGEAVEALKLAAEQNPADMIVDLTAVTETNNELIEVVAQAAHSELGHGGRLALVVSGDEMERAVRKTRLTDRPWVRVFRSRDEAIKGLAA